MLTAALPALALSAADTFRSTAAQIVQGTRVDTNTTNRPKAMLFEGPPGERPASTC